MSLITLAEKHPADDVDYSVDFTAFLTGGDTISTYSVTVTDGITLGSGDKEPGLVSGNVVFWLSGGENGATYYVSVSIVTAAGRHKTVEASITVMDASPG